ncbi:MAG: S1 RNA-binding domain-containing protein [Aquificae bacterium]|nr:S1 RNA-binding domain-containing protein [Aquificota bacterium]
MENFEQELEKYLTLQTNIKKGSTVTGKIVKISGDTAFVDIGMKSEAALPLGDEQLTEGQEIKAVFTGKRNKEGYFLLTRKPLLFREKLESLKQAYQNNQKVKATIEKPLEKGYIVDLQGIKAFMPLSESKIKKEEKLPEGFSTEVYILNIDEKRKTPNIVVSRKKVLQEEKEKEKEKILSLLEEGKTVKAKIKKITEKGLVLSIDDLITGFLPVSLLSWKKGVSPFSFTEGEEIEVIIKQLDKDSNKIIFSKRDLEPNPWQQFPHEKEDTVTASIKEINDYGLVVKVGELEGFIHKSETDHLHPEKYKENFKIGQKIDAKIIELDRENRRLKLSIKKAKPHPLEEFLKEHQEGSVIDAKIKEIKNKVAILDLGKVEGVLYVEDATWNPKIKNISQILKGKTNLKVKVLGIDRNKIKVGLKQFKEDPWKEFTQKYKKGDNITVTVKKLINRGAFVDIFEDLEGFIPLNEISKEKIKIPSDVLSLKQEVTAKIISIDPKTKTIVLSIKAVEKEKEKQELKEVIEKVKSKGDGLATLGEILKQKLNKG